MCGIIGEILETPEDTDFSRRQKSLFHRGPDATGYIELEGGKVRFGHQRLSIIDLSEKGNQPMSIDGYSITYNGEVYNFEELRRNIPGPYFSSTDTEVILRGYMKFGVRIFERLNGMFALAIYDPQKKAIILARDRMGIKPLYYYHTGKHFFFASEIQGLNVPFKLNISAVREFLSQDYIYGKEEIISGLYSLPSAAFAVFGITSGNFEITSYYMRSSVRQHINQSTAYDDCHDVLRDSVRGSLVSDVPVGVFLSSGVDSSLITALAREEIGKLNTFTVGFDFSSFDESKAAKEIADILDTNHHTIMLRKLEVIEEIPHVLDSFNMPFGDSSALPVYFLCKYARQYAKVCLSGDGADELFGGYPIYCLPKISRIYRKIPFTGLIGRLVTHLPTSFNSLGFDEKVKRFSYAAKHNYQKAHFLYRAMRNEGVLKREYQVEPDYFKEFFAETSGRKILDQLMYVDQRTVLLNDYLVKVDRMSMAHSLEVRLPYLNNQVIEFSNNLGSRLKVRNFTTKYLLKRILERYLPKRLIYRKKQGFSFPIATWLCNELKDFMLETLSRQNVEKTGILEYTQVHTMIERHVARKKNYNRELWGLISLVRYLTKNEHRR